MLEYVRNDAELGAIQPDGRPYRAHLTESTRLSGRTYAELKEREMPASLSYLHTWWSELARARGSSMGGIQPITYLDIDAWSRQTDQRPQPHEVDAIMAIDAEWRLAMSPATDKPAEKEPAQESTRSWPTKKAVS